MAKIKLNLVSGAVVEKPLICAFKANNLEYVVLDNEMNGSMGLPIILVCKLENGKLVKILDQNEWQIVKEYLKNIIAGSQVELIKVAPEIPADDIYYTQLTLPLPSFDALKNAYNIESEDTSTASSVAPTPETAPAASPSVPVEPVPETPVAPVIPETPVSPVENPNVNVMPEVNYTVGENPTPVAEPTIPNPTAPAIDLSMNMPSSEPATPEVAPVSSVEPVVPETPVAPETPVTPVMPTPDPVTASVAPVMPEAPATPTVGSTESAFKEQKEAFMQACENMFDALVQKFERELEKKQ